ncbi:hypothetical protein GCM10022251_56020 [Phytohabitans flavus]|uniref:PIN domain-containing protein n=1 Tax=Phytohabitans flavus TaxID=1076124 RepID=A0A6F8XQA9_9ACTN|nr:hypothetical protein [Phytohabitans flavus]BCB76022.1 hypothetical protein Pflav_024320 [Phytohabitans flavus]
MSDEHDGRPTRVVLDASAIIEFTRQSIHVGELLAEVADEGAVAALPVVCLVEAHHAVADTDRLDLLVNHRATALLADQPADWLALAATYDIVGRIDAASAVLAAIDHNCGVLTRQTGLYAGLDEGGLVIPIGE